jgi:chromosome segregation ATPase
MTTTYVHAFTENEVAANERDHAKRTQGCNECSLTGNEVNPYDQQSETYSHIFTAATAMAAKIERRAELDAEIPALEAEIAAAKSKHADALAAKDAEITALEAEIATAKSNRINKLAAMDAEITALEAEIAAHRS